QILPRDESGVRRMGRRGVLPLAGDEGLALFDMASRVDAAILVPARLDAGAFDGSAGPLPPILRALVRTPVRRRAGTGATGTGATDDGPLRERLTALTTAERNRTLLQLVRDHAATVLGHTDPASIGTGQAFKELGFDSLTAVEFRNRLATETGMRLPVTLVFDHPTPRDLTGHLYTLLFGESSEADNEVDNEVDIASPIMP